MRTRLRTRCRKKKKLREKRQNMSGTSPARLSPAEAHAAAGLLNYQEGAVVSRMLLKHAAGSVTLFAFDEGQGLTEHTSPFDALV